MKIHTMAIKKYINSYNYVGGQLGSFMTSATTCTVTTPACFIKVLRLNLSGGVNQFFNIYVTLAASRALHNSNSMTCFLKCASYLW